MNTVDATRLARLGAGDSIDSICQAAGMSRDEFDRWWQAACRSRVPPTSGTRLAGVQRPVEIRRDAWGIPHVFAENDSDLFFAHGYAMAQDRLFQLDYLRRKGLGRLAEILGADGVPVDAIARTVGLHRIAATEWTRLSGEVRAILEAFSAGINALIDEQKANLPVEFALLDYEPEPWCPIDSLAIEAEFRWYLTGRFPVICMPELARRTLGDGPLYRDYLLGEADDESILGPGEYARTASRPLPADPLGDLLGSTASDPDASTGSNNWVVGGSRTASGRPLVASDPHIAFEAVSCWYEAHLSGGSFDVAGMTYVGMPAIMFGRNRQVAWGITNNICSLRDLYQERMDPEHPDCFLFDGKWEPGCSRTEQIQVKGGQTISKTVRSSRNGPIVDELLPAPANASGPVSLKWLGAHEGGWLTALVNMNRARDASEFRECLRPWHVPTFSLVFADIAGTIGVHAAGRIPVRQVGERAYRPGWDPAHQWRGVIPFEQMPGVINPTRDWIATANNRLAPDDFPYPLCGCWSSGWRATRIRTMIEQRSRLTTDDMRAMQLDSVTLRGADLAPPLIELLRTSRDPRLLAAADLLAAWDHRAEPESVATTLFNVFFTHWCRTVAEERFPASAVELMQKGVEGVAGRLLKGDPNGWFRDDGRESKILAAMVGTIAQLTTRFGPDMSQWHWGRLHRMPLRHVLSSRGDLGKLLDHGGAAVRGDMLTVCNTGSGPDWVAASGAGYRLVADLSSSPPILRAVDGQSQSGNPGSPHYRDQYESWLAGQYHELPLDRRDVERLTVEVRELRPA